MKSLKKLGKVLSKSQQKEIKAGTSNTTLVEAGRAYCRCIGGIGGEGFVPSCGACANLCSVSGHYVCTG